MNNFDIYRQLYTLLEQNVFFGDRLAERKFVTLLSPGQFVSTALKESSQDDRRTIWNLTNKCLDSTFLDKQLISTVSGLYEEILEFAALPDKQVDQQKIDHVQTLVLQLEPSYKKYRALYENISGMLNREEQAEPRDEAAIIELRQKLYDALSDWVSRGHKDQYEDALGELNYLLSANPRTFWNGLKTEFRKHQREATKGKFLETYLSPPPAQWQAAGWEKVNLKVKSVFNHEYSKSTSFSAGASGGWGLWRAGGSYEKSTEYNHKDSKASDLDIAFEILAVDIDRPWLNRDIFDRRFWTWRKGVHEYITLSDGGNLTAIPPMRPLGPRGMPVLPDVMYVVRNVEMTGNWSEEDYTYYHEQVNARVSVGWGPFSASGSYSESTTEKTYAGTFANGKISITQPQILALGGTLLNKCPDPDRSLSWSNVPGEAPDFGDGLSPQELSAMRNARADEALEFIKRRVYRERMVQVEEELKTLEL